MAGGQLRVVVPAVGIGAHQSNVMQPPAQAQPPSVSSLPARDCIAHMR